MKQFFERIWRSGRTHVSYLPLGVRSTLVGALVFTMALVPLQMKWASASASSEATVACGAYAFTAQAPTRDFMNTWKSVYATAGNSSYALAEKLIASPVSQATQGESYDAFMNRTFERCLGRVASADESAYWGMVSGYESARPMLFEYVTRQSDLRPAPDLTAPTNPNPPTTPTQPGNGVAPSIGNKPPVAGPTQPTSGQPGNNAPSLGNKPSTGQVVVPKEVPCAGWTRGGSATPLCRPGTAGSHLDVIVEQVPGSNLVVNKAIVANVAQMRAAAAAAGFDLQGTPTSSPWASMSSYRTEEMQQWLRDRGYPAARGVSNHQWGLAMDLRCNGRSLSSHAACHNWMKAHAGSYGFSARVSGEPWHWSTTGY